MGTTINLYVRQYNTNLQGPNKIRIPFSYDLWMGESNIVLEIVIFTLILFLIIIVSLPTFCYRFDNNSLTVEARRQFVKIFWVFVGWSELEFYFSAKKSSEYFRKVSKSFPKNSYLKIVDRNVGDYLASIRIWTYVELQYSSLRTTIDYLQFVVRTDHVLK